MTSDNSKCSEKRENSANVVVGRIPFLIFPVWKILNVKISRCINQIIKGKALANGVAIWYFADEQTEQILLTLVSSPKRKILCLRIWPCWKFEELNLEQAAVSRLDFHIYISSADMTLNVDLNSVKEDNNFESTACFLLIIIIWRKLKASFVMK